MTLAAIEDFVLFGGRVYSGAIFTRARPSACGPHGEHAATAQGARCPRQDSAPISSPFLKHRDEDKGPRMDANDTDEHAAMDHRRPARHRRRLRRVCSRR